MARLMYAAASKHAAGSYEPGAWVWTGTGATIQFWKQDGTTATTATPPAAPWVALAGATVGDVRLVLGSRSQWVGRSSVYDVVDDPKPVYAVAEADRTGEFQLLVSTAAQRAAIITLLSSGLACRLMRDDATTDTDYCQSSNGLPQVDVAAWVATGFSEEFVVDDNDEYLYITVQWAEVTARVPVVLP